MSICASQLQLHKDLFTVPSCLQAGSVPSATRQMAKQRCILVFKTALLIWKHSWVQDCCARKAGEVTLTEPMQLCWFPSDQIWVIPTEVPSTTVPSLFLEIPLYNHSPCRAFVLQTHSLNAAFQCLPWFPVCLKKRRAQDVHLLFQWIEIFFSPLRF